MRKSVGALILSVFIAGALLAAASSAKATVSWGQEVTSVGMLYVGTPFKWGGKTPKGFDASGYTSFIYRESAANLHIPASSKAQYKLGRSVTKDALKEGDLVFFNTNGKDISFVGIYLGSNSFIASTSSKGVSVQKLNHPYWKKHYAGAKRILKHQY
ncbi:NlpC/P60 family protein [Bacillus lacus]|uniref:NlpC/P60 family protein n=2 Tax=Metabacillus lacus TaxID=1983721 RepID=A0A7X2M113_9BACI|nr:NlpC/P60 family protein [Metabacillus lacus]